MVAPVDRQGEWSKAFTYVWGGQSMVIRFSRFKEDFARDRLAASYRSTALPIPEVVELAWGGDCWYAITPFVQGVFLEDLDRHAFSEVLPSLLDALEAMQRAPIGERAGSGPWDGTGQGAYRSWREYLIDVGSDRPERRIHGWREQMSRNPEAVAIFEAGLEALRAALPTIPDLHQLVHNDLCHRNVFVANRRITGIIDWGCSLYGDGLYDLARIVFWADPKRLDEQAVITAARGRLGQEGDGFLDKIRAYKIHIGLDNMSYLAYLEPQRTEEMSRAGRRLEALIA